MIDKLFLQSHALFGGISDEQIDQVMVHLQQQQYQPGSYLFHQDETGDQLYLITQGSVEVLNDADLQDPVRLAVRSIGDSVGEMALIDVQNRSASVRALEPVTALSLSNDALGQIYQTNPLLFTQIIINIAREISRRLRSMDALLSCALYQSSKCCDPNQAKNPAAVKGSEK
ncbi:MAG: cyclic nucleotide-binding domain-containing protein [Halopseudomonas sp.]